MGVGAVLDQEDALGAAELRDALDVEGDVAPDVNEERCAGPVREGLGLEVGERCAEVVTIAVDEDDLRAGGPRRQRGRHERVRRTEHGAAADPGELERRKRRARPAARRDRRQVVPAVPGRFERLDQRALRPALRRERLIPELVQTGPIALIEADGEGAELGAFGGRHHQRHQRGDGAIAAAAPTLSTASSTGRLRASAARLRARRTWPEAVDRRGTTAGRAYRSGSEHDLNR